MNVHVPISIGEAFDRMAILAIKGDQLREDEEKLSHIMNEVGSLGLALRSALGEEFALGIFHDEDFKALISVNKKIWDGIGESNEWIGKPTFNAFEMQRRNEIYNQLNVDNNERFALKRKINERFNSSITEVKSHL
jgi:hypothetical protein